MCTWVVCHPHMCQLTETDTLDWDVALMQVKRFYFLKSPSVCPFSWGLQHLRKICIVFMNTQTLFPSVARAGLRLQHLAATLTVDSLHTRPYRQAVARAEAKQAYGTMAGTAGSEPLAFGPAKLAYTIVYVRDVPKAAEFYQKAFGVGVRRVDHSRRWAELETGSTTLAFTPLEQREAAITGGIHAPTAGEQRSNVEICFSFKDVDAAFKHAVATGAEPLAAPEPKEWGQKVGYVRDPDGVTIRLASELH